MDSRPISLHLPILKPLLPSVAPSALQHAGTHKHMILVQSVGKTAHPCPPSLATSAQEGEGGAGAAAAAFAGRPQVDGTSAARPEPRSPQAGQHTPVHMSKLLLVSPSSVECECEHARGPNCQSCWLQAALTTLVGPQRRPHSPCKDNTPLLCPHRLVALSHV